MGSKAYQEGLKPWLEDKQNKSYPNPFDFKSEKDFTYAAKTASLYKRVVAEIIKYIEDEAPTQVKDLTNKEEGKVQNFGIGRNV